MMMVATGDSLLIAAKKLIKVKSFNISFEETKRRWNVIEKAINFTIPCYLYSCQRLADILMKGLCSLRGTCQPAQPTNRFSDWKSVVNCHHTWNTVMYDISQSIVKDATDPGSYIDSLAWVILRSHILARLKHSETKHLKFIVKFTTNTFSPSPQPTSCPESLHCKKVQAVAKVSKLNPNSERWIYLSRWRSPCRLL